MREPGGVSVRRRSHCAEPNYCYLCRAAGRLRRTAAADCIINIYGKHHCSRRGDKNALLWHISEDLKYFKSVTSGHPVVMGRKTFESLGRPLPNRTNVVITRQNIEIPGCTVVHSLEEAVRLFPEDEEVFVIGGAQIYAQALPLAGRFYLTRVFHAYEGDTHFPAWNDAEWRLVSSESFASGANYPYPFAFETYERRRN